MKVTALIAAAALSVGSSMAMAAETPVKTETSTERVVSLDYGTLDTLDALGLRQYVVGVPKQTLPEYLSVYQDDSFTDVGGLKTPDQEAIRKAAPSVILLTSRQGDQREALEKIAPVVDMGLSDEDYMVAFEQRLNDLAERFHVKDKAATELKSLQDKISEVRKGIDSNTKVLVATHNQGNFMLNRHPVVYQVMGLSEPVLPSYVKSEQRGARIFTRLSPEAISDIKPDLLLIVDRSAAIGEEGVKVDQLRDSLGEFGKGLKIRVLNPVLWYLSGAGLQSLSLQIDEVAQEL